MGALISDIKNTLISDIKNTLISDIKINFILEWSDYKYFKNSIFKM